MSVRLLCLWIVMSWPSVALSDELPPLPFQAAGSGDVRMSLRATGARMFDPGVDSLMDGRHLVGGDLGVDARLLPGVLGGDVWLGLGWSSRAEQGQVYQTVDTQLSLDDLKGMAMWRLAGPRWLKPYVRAGAGARWLHTAWSTGAGRVVARDQTWMAEGAVGIDLLTSATTFSEQVGFGLSLESGYTHSPALSLARGGVEMGDLNTSAWTWSAGVLVQF